VKLKICAQSKIKWCSKKLQGRCLISVFEDYEKTFAQYHPDIVILYNKMSCFNYTVKRKEA
jgi:hypothetical protein